MESVKLPKVNTIMVIQPYWIYGTWVFDDPRVGLLQEPFVQGIPEMIDLITEDIPNAKKGFRLFFSANPIPGYQKRIEWLREEQEGNWYRDSETGMEGWLCPAMFHYFEKAPMVLYVKAESLTNINQLTDDEGECEFLVALKIIQEELSDMKIRCEGKASERGISKTTVNRAIAHVAKEYSRKFSEA
jgi:hypothetical protein